MTAAPCICLLHSTVQRHRKASSIPLTPVQQQHPSQHFAAAPCCSSTSTPPTAAAAPACQPRSGRTSVRVQLLESCVLLVLLQGAIAGFDCRSGVRGLAFGAGLEWGVRFGGGLLVPLRFVAAVAAVRLVCTLAPKTCRPGKLHSTHASQSQYQRENGDGQENK